jgi:HEAT repeat protein
VQLSQHPDGDIRRQAILQLGASGDPRALFPIVAHLFDRSEYWVSISIDMAHSEEMRCAAIEALASPQLDVSPIVPMLSDLLDEEWATVHAARALGHCRGQSDQILARMKDVKLVKPDDRALAIAATVARLEKDEPRRWLAMMSVLRLLRQPRHSAEGSPNFYRSTHAIVDTLQTLHREGISLEPLRAEIQFLAVDQSCLDFQTRAEIVTILAMISPEDSRWVNMLKFWRSQEGTRFGPADQLIDKLPEAVQNKAR